MRSTFRTVFITLVAVFALGAVAASSASAAPEWYVKKAGVYKKVTEAINVEGTANWEVTDKVGPLERFGIKCQSTDFGQIKPGGVSTIEVQQGFVCQAVKSCEKISGGLGVENGPWKLELYKEGAEIRSKVGSENGKTPGISFTCTHFGITKTDTCGVNTSTSITNVVLSGFVEATFDAKSAKTECTWSGTSKGEWTGTLETVKPRAGTGVEAIKVE